METEPFSETFGPKAQRKKPRLDVGTFEELSKIGAAATERTEDLAEGLSGIIIIIHVLLSSLTKPVVDSQQVFVGDFKPVHADYIEPIFAKGTSRRIYGELYKVIDSSDVILHILDARDPLGTICESVLEYLKKEKAHKQVVLVINKCDLVPNWVTVSVCLCHVQFEMRVLSDRQDIYNTLPQDTLQSPSTRRRITPSERVLSYNSFGSFRSFTQIRSKSP